MLIGDQIIKVSYIPGYGEKKLWPMIVLLWPCPWLTHPKYGQLLSVHPREQVISTYYSYSKLRTLLPISCKNKSHVFNKKLNPIAWICQLVRVDKIFTIWHFKVFVHKMKEHDEDCSSRFYYDCKLNSTQSYPVKLYLGRVALSTFG